MEEIMTVTERADQKAASRSSQHINNEEQEMLDCLARLKVWRIENLMSPNGMDRFRWDGQTIKSAHENGDFFALPLQLLIMRF